MTPALWHFTCAHGHLLIGPRGMLKPNPHPYLLEPLVWLTADPMPNRMAVGLTSDTLTCDRMAYRYRVTDTADCVRWLDSTHRQDARRSVVADLESLGEPWHWWVSARPLPARLS